MALVLRHWSFGKWTNGRGWDRLWFAAGREPGTGYGACAYGQRVLACLTPACGVYSEAQMQLFIHKEGLCRAGFAM